MICQPCKERHKGDINAEHYVSGTPMCSGCFRGGEDLDDRAARLARIRHLALARRAGRRQGIRIKRPWAVLAEEAKQFYKSAAIKCCPLCGNNVNKPRDIYCDRCRPIKAAVATAKSRLLSWKKTGSKRALYDAMQIIRDGKMQPEDFARF